MDTYMYFTCHHGHWTICMVWNYLQSRFQEFVWQNWTLKNHLSWNVIWKFYCSELHIARHSYDGPAAFHTMHQTAFNVGHAENYFTIALFLCFCENAYNWVRWSIPSCIRLQEWLNDGYWIIRLAECRVRPDIGYSVKLKLFFMSLF